MVRSMALVVLVLSLAACNAQPTPTPDTIATQVVQAQAVAATLTASAAAAPTSTSSPAPPTPTASIPPTPTASIPPTPTASIPPTSTHSPTPLPTQTPLPPSSCPSPAQPSRPSQPLAFEDYPDTLAAYLGAGATADELEELLGDWGALSEDGGGVRALDMTGDSDPEIVAFLVDPSPEDRMTPWPPGDVLIYQCREGSVEVAYQARLERDEDWDLLSLYLETLEDANGTGLVDLVYVDSSCGAHTCWERLSVVEWDGTGFRNRTSEMPSYPHPTFTLGDGVILVDEGGIGSLGAGVQRSREEEWVWNGDLYRFGAEAVGPPLVLIHHAHDGDTALARGDFAGAASYFQHILEDTGMDSGLFLESEAEGRAVMRAYARFKLVVTHAALGGEQVDAQYSLLESENPPGSPGRPFVRLAEVFRTSYRTHSNLEQACDAVVADAANDPAPAEMLYAGYANPEYDPARLCDAH